MEIAKAEDDEVPTTPAHNVTEKPEYIVIHDTDISIHKYSEQLSIVNGNHERRGYDLSANGFYVCYHYFIGTDGTIVQTRPDTDRTMCTKNNGINMKAMQIVLAGAFEYDEPTEAQMESLKQLVTKIQVRYGIKKEKVIPHQWASPTSCPGKNLMNLIWNHPKKGQEN